MDTSKLHSMNVLGFTIYFKNEQEFSWIYKEKFVENEWKVELDKKSPVIIDCGAHIGMATIYFKHLYPNAQVTAFEPNPGDFEILQLNMQINNIQNVTLVNKALTSAGDKTQFFIDTNTENPWSIGDSIVYNLSSLSRNITPKKIEVPATQLSQWINGPVDILKLDIEGAELIVMEEAKKKLPLVQHFLIDFHGTPKQNPENTIEKVVGILEHCGFSYKIYQPFKIKDVVQKLKTDNLNKRLYDSDEEKTLETIERDDNYRLTIVAENRAI